MIADRVEESYRRLRPRLWHSLRAYASGDGELASDAESEAFSQALRRDEIENIDAWIWRSAFAIAGGMLKDRGRTSSMIRFEPDDVEDDPDNLAFISQLDRLSEQQRAVVVLRYMANLRPREIAEVLNTTSASVRVQLHRAHNRLRDELEESR